MEFEVSIEQFDGPLDLMLHLIKENKLDLMDLDMDTLAGQYIDYIHNMQHMHLEIASEYLIEMASLIEYKSKKLLPREKVEVEEEYEEDQREKLVARLIEYQQYKEASLFFKDHFEQRQKLYEREVSPLVDEWKVTKESGQLESQSTYELLKAMQHVIKRQVILQPYETRMTIRELSVDERKNQIVERIQDKKDAFLFDFLCEDCTSLHMVIVTFLSILDLIHERWLTFTIDEDENIWLKKGE